MRRVGKRGTRIRTKASSSATTTKHNGTVVVGLPMVHRVLTWKRSTQLAAIVLAAALVAYVVIVSLFVVDVDVDVDVAFLHHTYSCAPPRRVESVRCPCCCAFSMRFPRCFLA